MPADTVDRLFDPLLTHDLAARVRDFEVADDVSERLEELRAKAGNGQLTDAERREYERVIEALDVISLLKVRALRLDR